MQVQLSIPPTDEGAKALKKYTLLTQLATGGMAELFLARAKGLGGFERLLVIKKILPSLAGDAEFVRMLLDEARIAATLQHSNIVQVFDVDMDDGAVFYAMEHLHGQPVTEMIKRGNRMPLENAIAITIAVAAGLHYAHERWGPDGQPLEIVHRDVSPDNVVVTYDGNVKLIDFGIAKAAGRLSSTRFGLFKGKLPYASPEQCLCEPVDRRADVYSLGVMLYELTTGQRAFQADSEFELLKRMTAAIVTRPRMLDKTYPQRLEQIVLKALAKDPGERYQTAQAMQRDLEVFATEARLDLSAFSLSRLMEKLFGEAIASWRDARRAGLRLEEHISRITGIVTATPDPEASEPAADDDDDDVDTETDDRHSAADTTRSLHLPKLARVVALARPVTRVEPKPTAVTVVVTPPVAESTGPVARIHAVVEPEPSRFTPARIAILIALVLAVGVTAGIGLGGKHTVAAVKAPPPPVPQVTPLEPSAVPAVPTPAVEAPKAVVEAPKPAAVEAAPVVESPTPAVESPAARAAIAASKPAATKPARPKRPVPHAQKPAQLDNDALDDISPRSK